jgi:hypothetical protein
MRRLLLFSVLITIVLASCSKTNKSTIAPEAAISATIDGVNMTFNSKDSVRTVGSTVIYLAGSNDTTSNKIMIYIINPSKVDTGTYSSNAPDSRDLEILYGVGPGNTPDNVFYTYDIADGASFDATLKVTSVTSTNIKGTFSGKVVLESSVLTANPVTKTITNGKFNLAIKQP